MKEDKFTNLKINSATGTATVTYQKFYDNSPAMLVLGEFETYERLANVNLVQINTEEQEVNSFVPYSVSIPGATGDLKAMLLDFVSHRLAYCLLSVMQENGCSGYVA